MTDIRNSGLRRETLLAADGTIRIASIRRETLLAADGTIRFSRISREVLRSAATGTITIKAASMYREALLGTHLASVDFCAVSILW